MEHVCASASHMYVMRDDVLYDLRDGGSHFPEWAYMSIEISLGCVRSRASIDHGDTWESALISDNDA